MKTITKYQTKDGREFNDDKSAKAHEFLCTKVANAIHPLGTIPEKVSNGDGWIQHSRASVENTKLALLLLAKPLFKGWENLQKAYNNDPLSIHPHSFMGRLLSDCDTPIYSGWNRLMCIDDKYREHQQPYFALNGPDKGHVCIVDRS